MTGDAKVTLCSEAVCSGQTATCSAPITCDSSGANGDPSPTVSCSASFKVVGVSYILTWYDYSSIGNPINNGTNSGSNTLNNGKVGFSTYDQYGSDSVTLTVK
jgi:hypothetical protein